MLRSDAEDVYLGLRGQDSVASWVVAREVPECPLTPGSLRRRYRGPRTIGTTKVASGTKKEHGKKQVLRAEESVCDGYSTRVEEL